MLIHAMVHIGLLAMQGATVGPLSIGEPISKVERSMGQTYEQGVCYAEKAGPPCAMARSYKAMGSQVNLTFLHDPDTGKLVLVHVVLSVKSSCDKYAEEMHRAGLWKWNGVVALSTNYPQHPGPWKLDGWGDGYRSYSFGAYGAEMDSKARGCRFILGEE